MNIPAPLPARIAVVVVREGRLPVGAGEATAEAGGAALLVGSGTKEACGALSSALRVCTAETGSAPGALAAVLAPLLAPVHTVILPASPDGRDLAPRLADTLRRPLLAGALEIFTHGADVLRQDGGVLVELTVDGPFVATLEPGLRGVEPVPGEPELTELEVLEAAPVADARRLAVLDGAAGGDLSSARRILAAGGGLGGPDAVRQLAEVCTALDADLGATRVVTDAGWLGYERQIGTTGVEVDPDLYVAFGISGAPHHTGGLGSPRRVVSVNTDPYCPMTAMADLGIVADAREVLSELAVLTQHLTMQDAEGGDGHATVDDA
ncbi:mycofactocin-associated electron transfer flavoprotein alpha subunit [Streptomyces monticola]|uniref:Mycofactocin-associated electron transfer flavoprotein alpha subunit n=1 Tax=Streptomyces monticola TaxID=2666263 RepID=A0ABW2JY61_9ACTN